MNEEACVDAVPTVLARKARGVCPGKKPPSATDCTQKVRKYGDTSFIPHATSPRPRTPQPPRPARDDLARALLNLNRRFLWSVKDMPLPDGRTVPEPVEVASLPFSWLGGLSGGAATVAAAAAPQISAVGYYDAQGADGAPTEVQVVARAAGDTIAVITARVHRANARSRYVFRNTRSVVLPLGQAAGTAPGPVPTRGGGRVSGAARKSKRAAKGSLPEGVCHPNLPLLARLERSEGDATGAGGGWAVEVHSWVNGGSHLQCIPCKPRGSGKGQLGHTAGAEPGGSADEAGRRGVAVSPRSSAFDSSDSDDVNGKDRVAPVFGELAQKVRSGDELSFIPYALPSLTLTCRSRCESTGGDASPGVAAVCYCGAGAACGGQARGQIKLAMWMLDWIGAEALPPALAVIDGKSRLHVFELDDGTSTAPSAADSGGGGGTLSAESGDRFNPSGLVGKRMTTAKSSSGSLVSLSNNSGHLHMKGMVDVDVEQDMKEGNRASSPERASRRARAEFGGPSSSSGEDRPPVEKTVVLPLDSKYGLGLTLAFEGNRVRGWDGMGWDGRGGGRRREGFDNLRYCPAAAVEEPRHETDRHTAAGSLVLASKHTRSFLPLLIGASIGSSVYRIPRWTHACKCRSLCCVLGSPLIKKNVSMNV